MMERVKAFPATSIFLLVFFLCVCESLGNLLPPIEPSSATVYKTRKFWIISNTPISGALGLDNPNPLIL